MAEEKGDKEYCVYIHTVPKEISGYDWDKYYVGQTKRSIEARSGKNGSGYKHCTHFWNAIQKYGWDNMQHEVIASGLTKEQADCLEIFMIAKLQSNNNVYGYNMTAGGEGATGLIAPNRVDLVGRRYGRLTVTALEKSVYNNSGEKTLIWRCKCDCGNDFLAESSNLRSKKGARSCGCLIGESIKARRKLNLYDDIGDCMCLHIDSLNILIDYDVYEKIKNRTWAIRKSDNRIFTDNIEIGEKRGSHYLLYEVLGIPVARKIIKVKFKNKNIYDYRRNNIEIICPEGCSFDEYFEYLKSGVPFVQWNKRERKWIVYYKKNSKVLICKRFFVFKDAKSFLFEQIDKGNIDLRNIDMNILKEAGYND